MIKGKERKKRKGKRLLLGLQELRPLLLTRKLDVANVLIQIKQQFQRVPRAQIRKRSLGTLQANTRLDLATGRRLIMRTRHGEPLLQDFVGGQGETELRRGTDDTGRTALEERAEAFVLPDGCCAVAEAGVADIALAGFDLQTGLDDVAGCCQVGGGHTGDGTGCEELDDAELVAGGFAEHFGFQVRVGREVDSGEGD